MRKYLGLFRKNGGHIWGAAAQPPLHTAFGLVAHYKQTSFLYITACEPTFGGTGFRGERFKYFTKIFRKIRSTLGGWLPMTPENIEI